jgi:hypothetical protein
VTVGTEGAIFIWHMPKAVLGQNWVKWWEKTADQST